MRAVVVVVDEPGRDHGAELAGAHPVAEPDELLLEREDE